MTDFRYAWRQIRNSPAFAAVVVLLMAIGIAANASIFTLVDALLLRKLPVRNPEELVRIVEHHPPIPDSSYFEYSYWRFLRSQSASFTDVIGQADWTTTITLDGVTDFVNIGLVTDNYFPALGVHVNLPSDDSAVLSDRYWRQKFNSDPAAVGRVIQLNGHPFTIAGITPPEFHGTTVELNPDLRVPAKAALQMIDFAPGQAREEGFFSYEICARLKPGVSLERAHSETTSMYESWRQEFAKQHKDVALGDLKLNGELQVQSIERGVSVLRDQFASALTLLMAGVGLVLLMVCSNVAGLLLERATARERDTAVRLAVGATQGRLMRQWLTETLVLTVAGGMFGVALSLIAMPILSALIPSTRNRAGELLVIDPQLGLNWRVIAFSFACCVVAALVAGISPAWRAGRHDLAQTLRSGRSSSRVEGGITVLQVALCTLLLIEAGLFARTLSAMRAMDVGFDRDHVAAFTLRPEHPTMGETPGKSAFSTFSDTLVNEAKQLPGVRAAACARSGLLRGFGMKSTVGLPGERVRPADFMNSSLNSVSHEYFDTLGIRLAAGRDLLRTDLEVAGITPVVVNQTFAKRFFPGQDPIGKLFGVAGPGEVVKPGKQIVGVVSDSQYRSLREPVPPTFYTVDFGTNTILHIRTAGDPSSLIAPVRDLVRKHALGWSIKEINLLRDEAERSIWRERLVAQLAIAFAVVAALLAAIGLYGTLAYYVARNQRGIGIRMAIGATSSDVIALLAARVTRLVALGAAMGLAAAFALSGWVRALLFGVAPTDPLAMGMAVGLLITIALISLLPPAWRATRIDPAITLRQE